MYFTRTIDSYLLEWKIELRRKPLLLRGARQVGKSSAIRHLGETFDFFVEINFEKRPDLINLFEQVHDVHQLTEKLSALFDTPIIAGRTLLFLDEIQSCSAAIKSLWFFKEDYPELHVAAAGSLLEFALNNLSSFGVGRIRSMFLYPLSFDEFLGAIGKSSWINEKRKANKDNPLFSALHNDLVQQYRTFLLVGGMPASVLAWVETHDFLVCKSELQDIQITYYDDFPKYSKKIDTTLLRNTLRSVIAQVGKKFTFAKVEGNYRANEVKQALALLCDAGIIKRVSHTAGNGLPLGAEVNEKFRKYIYLDSGLLLSILDMDLGENAPLKEMIITGAATDLVNKGGLAEMVLGWELVKYSNPRIKQELYYWENTAESTSSEVDYLIAQNFKVIPIECKAGISGKMKSLRLFMHNKHIDHAIRCSLENFSQLTVPDSNAAQGKSVIDILPLYAISNLIMRDITAQI